MKYLIGIHTGQIAFPANLQSKNFKMSDTSLTLNADNFIKFCSEKMKSERCDKVFDETKEQSLKADWCYQRLARITASRLYEICHCQTLGTCYFHCWRFYIFGPF